MMQLESGQMATSPHQCRQRWQQFFCDKLCGSPADLSDVLKSCSQRQRANFTELCSSGITVTIDDVPSIRQLAAMFGKAKKGKGHGEEALPAEMYKVAPQFFAKSVHQLYTKAFFRLEEPLSFKGGMLA